MENKWVSLFKYKCVNKNIFVWLSKCFCMFICISEQVIMCMDRDSQVWWTHILWLDTDSLVLGVDFRNNNIHFPGPSESQDVGLLRVVCSIWPASFSLPTVLLLSLIPPDTHITYSPQLLPDPSCLRKKMFPFRIHPIVEDAELGAQDIRSAPGGKWSE